MATGQHNFPHMHPVAGFKLGTTSAGIKTPGRPDIVIMEITHGSSVAALFTQNAFCAAPVTLCKKHLDESRNISSFKRYRKNDSKKREFRRDSFSKNY